MLLLLLLLSPPKPLDIQAEHLELDHLKGLARFEGEVQVQQGELHLRCEQLTARYGGSGELIELLAEGQLRLKMPGLSARAARGRLSQPEGRLELSGHPKIWRGEDELEGEKILLWLKSQRLVIKKAKGRLNFPNLQRGLR